MNYSDLKDFVATRPVYHLRGLVYKASNDAWAGTPTEDDVDIWLDDGDFVLNGNSVSCEAGNELPIGAAVSKIAQLSLVKSTKYTAADFVGAVINLGAYAERTPTNETVLGGNFFVSSVTEENNAIKIVAQDELALADKEYKMTLAGSSWTLLEIFEDVVKQIRTVSAHFDYEFLNDGFRVFAKPVGYTCRQMLGFIAMIACGNAYATSPMAGVVKIKTLSTASPYNTLNQWLELEDNAGTISVTGLRAVQRKNINGKDVDPPVEIKSSPYSDEYAITVDNPLIVGVEGIALARMLPTLSALQFHKFKGKHIGYPLAEYGDYAVVTHRGGTFNTFLTNITWNISGATEFECNIDTAAENAADYDNSNGTIEKIEDEEPTTQVFDKPTTFNSTAAFNGAASFADAATFDGSAKLNGGTEFYGEIEVYGDTPHVDFHHANSTDDYTTRIIENERGLLNILAPKGLQLNGSNLKYDDTAIKNRLAAIESHENVTLTANASRITNVSYTAKYFPLLGIVFVRIYGKINAALNAGYDYDLFAINSRVPDSNAALSVKCGKNAMAVAKTSSSGSAIQIRPLESGINGYDVYITGFWFV
nr:MAG TPA: hypothetical protein [Bacteriophage sp.]